MLLPTLHLQRNLEFLEVLVGNFGVMHTILRTVDDGDVFLTRERGSNACATVSCRRQLQGDISGQSQAKRQMSERLFQNTVDTACSRTDRKSVV